MDNLYPTASPQTYPCASRTAHIEDIVLQMMLDTLIDAGHSMLDTFEGSYWTLCCEVTVTYSHYRSTCTFCYRYASSHMYE